MLENNSRRYESERDIAAYLANLKYALNNGARIIIQEKRGVDKGRNIRHTNYFTIANLFPDEKPTDALKRELRSLTVEDYIGTVKDERFPNKSEMREFGKVYNGSDEVYIKIRVELFDPNDYGNHTTFVMSFHYAVIPFAREKFPYREQI